MRLNSALPRVYKALPGLQGRGLQKGAQLYRLRQIVACRAEARVAGGHAPVGEQKLCALAQDRAATVRQWIEGKVDTARIDTVAPKLDADGISDKRATTRVDFSLH
ncbi:hypothetical protein KM188_13470 [Mycetohabitans sp. B4]|nr:hypothetical protein [Mycetohabitans sp. B4]